jgi:hypothetical protein
MDGRRAAAVFLAAMGVVAMVAAREAWTVGAGGVLVVGAVASAWRDVARVRAPRVPWRRVVVGVLGIAALTGVAQAVGVLVRDDGEAAGGDAARDHGRHLLPAVPRGAAFAAVLGDGSRVHAWPVRTGVLHLRVDTSAARCSGGPWREWWHMADLPRLRVASDGAFHGAGGRVEHLRPARHTVRYVVDGLVDGATVRGTLRRTDAYVGDVDGVCRRTVRFAARRAD